MGAKGISAIAGAVLVAMAFEPTTLIAKIAYGIFGAAAGSIVGETIETETVNVRKQIEEMKTFREYLAVQRAAMQAESKA
jgi:hypothetical protein